MTNQQLQYAWYVYHYQYTMALHAYNAMRQSSQLQTSQASKDVKIEVKEEEIQSMRPIMMVCQNENLNQTKIEEPACPKLELTPTDTLITKENELREIQSEGQDQKIVPEKEKVHARNYSKKQVYDSSFKNIPKNLGLHLRKFIIQYQKLKDLKVSPVVQQFIECKKDKQFNYSIKAFHDLFEDEMGQMLGYEFFSRKEVVQAIMGAERIGNRQQMVKSIKEFYRMALKRRVLME